MTMNPNEVRVIDPILSTVANGYQHTEHVGHTLFPRVPVGTTGGQVLEFGKESFKLYKTRRAPGTNTRRIQFGYLGKPFNLVQDALENQVPREYLRDAAKVPGVDLGIRAVKGTMSALSLNLEYDQAQLATNAANYDNDHKITLAGADKWSDATSDPVGDIEAAKEAVRSTIGFRPNTLLLSAQAFGALKNHPDILERIKYTSRDAVTADLIANLWEFKKVVVGDAVTFDDGGAGVDVWGNNAILAYVPTNPSGLEEPSFGYTYTMEGHPLVEKPYYDNSAKSWIYPVTYERVPVLTGILSGFLIINPA